jgi:hypothetical protein
MIIIKMMMKIMITLRVLANDISILLSSVDVSNDVTNHDNDNDNNNNDDDDDNSVYTYRIFHISHSTKIIDIITSIVVMIMINTIIISSTITIIISRITYSHHYNVNR